MIFVASDLHLWITFVDHYSTPLDTLKYGRTFCIIAHSLLYQNHCITSHWIIDTTIIVLKCCVTGPFIFAWWLPASFAQLLLFGTAALALCKDSLLICRVLNVLLVIVACYCNASVAYTPGDKFLEWFTYLANQDDSGSVKTTWSRMSFKKKSDMRMLREHNYIWQEFAVSFGDTCWATELFRLLWQLRLSWAELNNDISFNLCSSWVALLHGNAHWSTKKSYLSLVVWQHK